MKKLLLSALGLATGFGAFAISVVDCLCGPTCRAGPPCSRSRYAEHARGDVVQPEFSDEPLGGHPA